ncbi:MAG: CoA transferase [Nitrososphaerota archaeon]|jgi:crotonobetainyl-CoA:carnitine CoA-transferase CaiB-like acyl-CoA transferase|nr:CoA transferase [Nitrososphaerota archaeon]
MEPVSGIKVLDASRLLPGGFCSMILADLGADVIKVEEPGVGDYMRMAPPLVDGVSPFHTIVNRNKRSVALDLKKERGREAMRRLVKWADVFIEGFRPGVMERLGFSFSEVKRYNPGIVYCSITAFGAGDPMSRIPGHDINFQAMSGVFSYSEKPSFPGVQYADFVAGLYAAIGILAALTRMPRKAVHIDVPIVQSLTSLLILHTASYLENSPSELSGLLYGQEAYYNIYRTKDNRYIAVAAIEKEFRNNLLKILGAPELERLMFGSVKDRKRARFALAKIFRQKTRDEWSSILLKSETCATPVLDISEALNSAFGGSVFEKGAGILFSPLKFNGERAKALRKRAPELGRDTKDVLHSLGLDDSKSGIRSSRTSIKRRII